MEPITITALALSITSGLVIFVRSIRKCRCSKQGLFLERDTEKDELSNQQEFTLKLIELMQTYQATQQHLKNEPEKREKEVSEIIVPEIKQQMSEMIDILDKQISTKQEGATPKKKITQFISRKDMEK